jgi:hypothetical protein
MVNIQSENISTALCGDKVETEFVPSTLRIRTDFTCCKYIFCFQTPILCNDGML